MIAGQRILELLASLDRDSGKSLRSHGDGAINEWDLLKFSSIGA
jgi:hypothetical protein